MGVVSNQDRTTRGGCVHQATAANAEDELTGTTQTWIVKSDE